MNVTPTTIFDNTQHPNFSATGAPIQFGFFRANGTSVNGPGYTLAAGIDNWQVTLTAVTAQTPPSAIPAVGMAGLAFLAGLLLLATAFLRRAR